MAINPVSQEWWRDPRHHFGQLTIDSPLLFQRDDIRPAVEFITTELALPTDARILDLCCGPGRYAVELAHQGYDVVGLDINEQYIALARQLAEREGVQATFLTGDMRRSRSRAISMPLSMWALLLASLTARSRIAS